MDSGTRASAHCYWHTWQALVCCSRHLVLVFVRELIEVTETHWAVSSEHPPTNFEKVQEFHRATWANAPDKPTIASVERQYLREDLIREEWEELLEALYEQDVEHIAKELADLLYVVYGTADEYGIPMDTVFAKVHISNMSKLNDGAFRHDGKYVKGPSYKPPDLSFLRESVSQVREERS
jgi:predicted HAD superfamily Cof-like phosphohydrolase